MQSTEYLLVKKGGAYYTSYGKFRNYRKVAIPRKNIIGFIPYDTQKKITRILKGQHDLIEVYRRVRESFYNHIKGRKKEDLNIIENIGPVEIVKGVIIHLEARRIGDRYNNGDRTLFMGRDYAIKIK